MLGCLLPAGLNTGYDGAISVTGVVPAILLWTCQGALGSQEIQTSFFQDVLLGAYVQL